MEDEKADEYPEHTKMHAAKPESQSIGRFLDWLINERKPSTAIYEYQRQLPWPPGHEVTAREHRFAEKFIAGEYVPIIASIEKLLAQYFEIDLDKIEQERLKMLEAQRALNGDEGERPE